MKHNVACSLSSKKVFIRVPLLSISSIHFLIKSYPCSLTAVIAEKKEIGGERERERERERDQKYTDCDKGENFVFGCLETVNT